MKRYVLPLIISVCVGLAFISIFKSCNKPSCKEMSIQFKSCVDIKISEDKSCDINDFLSVIEDCKLELIKKYD